MKFWLPYFIFIFFVFAANSTFAQTRTIDSLKSKINAVSIEREKIKAIFSLCELGYTLHPDTLMKYAEAGKTLAIKQGDLHDEVQAMYYQSGALTTKGQIELSMIMADNCLSILSAGNIDDPSLTGNLFNQKGRCFMRKSQYREAIEMGYQTINKAEQAADLLLQVKGKTLIGWAFLEMGQTRDALSWHLKAMRTTNDTVLLARYGILFANLALNYNGLGKSDSSFYYINKAINYSRRHENLFALSNSLAIQAQLLVRNGEANKAEQPLKEAVEIRKLIGDPFYVVSDMGQLGLYYANNKQPEKGITICNEGIAIARQYKLETKLVFLYSSLAENYKAAGNQSAYATVLERLLLLKDSVYQKNSAQSLAEVQTRYETEKNQNIIAHQQLKLVKKNYWLYGSIGLFVLGIIIFFLLFSNYRKKQKLKNKLLLENERKRIAAELHDNLGAYAASLSSNLNYLQQEYSNAPADTAFREIKNNSNAIISELNDTIWVLKKDVLSLTAISDRIKVFANHIRKSYPEISVEVDEKIEKDVRLASAKAFHLYRLVQEAINNSLRHSKAKNIVISISSMDDWKVMITDDGMGMANIGSSNGTGNGLANMRERSKEAGWHIDWLQPVEGGTVVAISGTTD